MFLGTRQRQYVPHRPQEKRKPAILPYGDIPGMITLPEAIPRCRERMIVSVDNETVVGPEGRARFTAMMSIASTAMGLAICGLLTHPAAYCLPCARPLCSSIVLFWQSAQLCCVVLRGPAAPDRAPARDIRLREDPAAATRQTQHEMQLRQRQCVPPW